MDDLKNLLLYSLVQKESEVKPPFTPKEEKATLDKYADPEFVDTVSFTLARKNVEPGRLFSRGALEKFLHNLRLFVGGRILGNYNKTGKPSEVLVVHIQIEHLTIDEYEERIKNENNNP